LIERAMDVDVTVLISGETGTGKELVARAIHAGSTRRAKPLIPVNCAAIPRELLASELFGYRKGAFTGAFEDRPGLFETVSGGTLLLDEIGDMPLDAQVFLLRALQERKIQRLGDEMHLRDVDVRVLAATNRNLEADVESGRFRKDLFYRLNLFPITIPPLCERPDDIPLLADLFIRDACREFDRAVDGIAPEALNALQAYPWHGNVRQLQNEIQRAVVLSSDGAKLGLAHFSPEIVRAPASQTARPASDLTYREAVQHYETQLIRAALDACDGNRTQAAERLGMSRTNLLGIMKRLGITDAG